MGIFSGLQFFRDIILWAFMQVTAAKALSYRDLEEMITSALRAGRSHHDLPLGAEIRSSSWISKLAGHRQIPYWQARSWRVDETYIRVGGK